MRDADGHIRNIDQGDYVTKGTVLATVQQDDFQQKLDQAKAQLEKSQADHERASLSFGRMSVLYAVGAATQPDFDDTDAQDKSTAAAVDEPTHRSRKHKSHSTIANLRRPSIPGS